MKAVSIVLLLISFSFTTMEADSLSKSRKKIGLNKWRGIQRSLVPIPIEAILDENTIEVCFLQNVDNQVTLQVRDQYGNIILQDVVVPVEQEIHTIDASSLEAGYYKLFYIEGNKVFVGEFDIDSQIP